jgi:hypothetical protein
VQIDRVVLHLEIRSAVDLYNKYKTFYLPAYGGRLLWGLASGSAGSASLIVGLEGGLWRSEGGFVPPVVGHDG